MPGSALHSKNTRIGKFSLPYTIRINDFPVLFSHVMYHHVPLSRLLVPFSTPYHLSSKALEENYEYHFAPIVSSSAEDNLAQFTFFKYLEEMKKFKSPAYLIDFTKINKEKRWRIRKKMKIQLSGVFQDVGLSDDPALRGIFKKVLSNRRRPRPKDNRIRIFGRKHRPADILMFILCSLNKAKSALLEQRAYLTQCKAGIKQFRRLRASYRASKERLLDVGHYRHIEEKNENSGDEDNNEVDDDDDEAADKRARDALMKSVKLMNSLFSLAGKRIKRLKVLKRRILREIAAARAVIKRFKKKLPYLKKSVRALSAYHFTAGLLSKTPSAMNVTNIFSHDGFFAALKGKRQEFMPFDRKLARKIVPEMISNLQFKRRFKKISKFYLKVAFSKKGKSNIFSIFSNNKKLRTLPALRFISYLHSATKDISLYEGSGAINLSIFRKRGHPFIYNYALSRPSRPFKKVIFALKEFYICLAAYLKRKYKYKYPLRKRLFRRPGYAVRFRVFRILTSLRMRVLSLMRGLTVHSVFGAFSGNLGVNVFKILRSEKHINNLFVDLVGLVNKFRCPRRLALGETYTAPYHLRKFPVEHEVRPFSFPPLARKEPNWSFLEFKNSVRHFYKIFSMEHYMHCVSFLRLSFNHDIKDLLLGTYSHCDRGRTMTLLQKSFFTINSGISLPTALQIKDEMFDSYPVSPYIDDVKEALSIDFLPEADADKTQLDDGEYKRSLLFTNPTAFLLEFQSSAAEVDPFSLKELKFINSLIIGAINNIDYSSNADDYAYLEIGDEEFASPLVPYEFQLVFDTVRRVVDVLKPLLRSLDKTYPGDKWSTEVDAAPGWLVFNRLIATLIPIYNGIKLITKLCRSPSENIKNFFINPLAGDHY